MIWGGSYIIFFNPAPPKRLAISTNIAKNLTIPWYCRIYNSIADYGIDLAGWPNRKSKVANSKKIKVGIYLCKTKTTQLPIAKLRTRHQYQDGKPRTKADTNSIKNSRPRPESNFNTRIPNASTKSRWYTSGSWFDITSIDKVLEF